MIHHGLSTECAHRGSDSICHDHEEALRAVSLLRSCLLIDIERAADIEEIESDAVDNHRNDEEPHAASRVAETEEAEAEHPGKHSHQHHTLDAEAFQAERNQKDAESLTQLGERDKEVGITGEIIVGIGRYVLETRYEDVAITVGDLK